MKTKAYLIVSALIFTVVALVHLLRFAQGWPVMLGSTSIPVWCSIVAALVSGGAAAWGFSLARRDI
jgi:hypothetical protein